jgi:hypothetical protein
MLAIVMLCFAALLALGGCDLPRLGPASAATAIPFTPSSTATPVPWGARRTNSLRDGPRITPAFQPRAAAGVAG